MTNPRIPKVDRIDPRLRLAQRLMAEIADERCGDPGNFLVRSRSVREVMADIAWLDEEEWMSVVVTDVPEVEVEGERYRRLDKQPSSVVVHGLWGAHRVQEPLYRLVSVRNGPTLKPLLCKLGVVDGSLLPDLAEAAGELMAKMPSREVETTLMRMGCRPPSRTTLANRLGGLFSEISTRVRELEDECRAAEELDFELAAVSCGLDRFAVRMDETLPEGPQRDHKLAKRRPADEYQRTPPEPYDSNWRMAWAANVTLYDAKGYPRRTYRYGGDASHDVDQLAARAVDDVVDLCEGRRDVHVACVQDGAADLEPLRRELRERIPEGVPRMELVDFHHSIGYLDAVVAARGDGDPDDMAGWYRLKMLTDESGAETIVRHLRAERDNLDSNAKPELRVALHEAHRFFEKRRPMMKYAVAHEHCLPMGSGATESTCRQFQLRVKRPGSHWRSSTLDHVMAARALQLSDRWAPAFATIHAELRREVRQA
jgi:hypothetical protein